MPRLLTSTNRVPFAAIEKFLEVGGWGGETKTLLLDMLSVGVYRHLSRDGE